MMNIFATYLNIRLKNYLKLPIVNLNSPHEEEAPYHTLAIAIIKNKIFYIKKIIMGIHSNFSTVTVILLSMLTTQCNESPSSSSNNFNISCGTTDLIELGPPLLNFVLYSKIGIPPYLCLMYYILSLFNYLKLPFIILKKGYYNNLYILVPP